MPLPLLIAEAGISPDGARAIQLALAPVFLLTGIAGMLNVMSGRLSRVIDRGRRLREDPPDETRLPPEQRALQLKVLDRRRHLASIAITACTVAALLTCLVIVLLFAEVLLRLPLKWLEGALFTGAVLALIIGLTFFLREVHLATHSVRLEFPLTPPEPPAPPTPAPPPDQHKQT